ncbi:RING finger protein nhl-1-like, partial [Nilaparvata lugens]|uniref:RING finger protein nhl-1-like n=1 Tax=Nilaparvata lugens TaxID=108931 RepID=UPI00193DAEF4
MPGPISKSKAPTMPAFLLYGTCMDGLVDYVRRQVKCPECRAEHRIPYQGVQGYPTNVTLQRFLELHIEITGELQIYQCSGKEYTFCVRRALHRLQDMLGVVEKNMLALQTNCSSVSEEVDEIYRRLTKALKDRTEYLRVRWIDTSQL